MVAAVLKSSDNDKKIIFLIRSFGSVFRAWEKLEELTNVRSHTTEILRRLTAFTLCLIVFLPFREFKHRVVGSPDTLIEAKAAGKAIMLSTNTSPTVVSATRLLA
jgi:hypothetical protein